MKCMNKNRQVADTPYSGKEQRKHLVKRDLSLVQKWVHQIRSPFHFPLRVVGGGSLKQVF